MTPTRRAALAMCTAMVAAAPAGAGSTPPPPGRQAEAIFDPEEMAAARRRLKATHGSGTRTFVMLDRLEYAHGGATRAARFEGQGWHGSDLHKAWLKTEGEYDTSEATFEAAEVQLLYSRAVAPFWDLQAGVRIDAAPDGTRTSAALALLGLAPYWFEVDLSAFVTADGVPSLRLEVEYDLRLTQRLIAQPRIEVNAAADDAGTTRDDGVGEFEAGLRLRYEVKREFAPYLGVAYGHGFEGDGAGGDWTALAGVRVWY